MAAVDLHPKRAHTIQHVGALRSHQHPPSTLPHCQPQLPPAPVQCEARNSRLQPEHDGRGGFDEQRPGAEPRSARRSPPNFPLVTHPSSHAHSTCSNNGAGINALCVESATTSIGNSEVDSLGTLVGIATGSEESWEGVPSGSRKSDRREPESHTQFKRMPPRSSRRMSHLTQRIEQKSNEKKSSHDIQASQPVTIGEEITPELQESIKNEWRPEIKPNVCQSGLRGDGNWIDHDFHASGW